MIVDSIELENGNKINFTRSRAGGVTISFDKGGIPSALKGLWLDLHRAKEKALYYVANRPKSKTKEK